MSAAGAPGGLRRPGAHAAAQPARRCLCMRLLRFGGALRCPLAHVRHAAAWLVCAIVFCLCPWEAGSCASLLPVVEAVCFGAERIRCGRRWCSYSQAQARLSSG